MKAREIAMKQTQQRYEVQVDHNVLVPMRDGTNLSAEVCRPKGEGRWPAIVVRHGYDPTDSLDVAKAKLFSARGYAFIYNNTRGTYQSEGAFFLFIDDGWGE